MSTAGNSKFSYLLIGLSWGTLGELMAAILARKETREVLRDRGDSPRLDFLVNGP